jgi:hypothetical protein
MITYALLQVIGYPIIYILSFVPTFPASFSSQLDSGVTFFTSVIVFAWSWRNWIPLQLIAICAGVIFTIWIATISLRFFRVIYSMFFGGGGSV